MSPSLPLPKNGSIDLAQLRLSTLGDPRLEREVLTLFASQAGRLLRLLSDLPPDTGALAHTLKGSARAIGAHEVAEAAGAIEIAPRDGEAPASALAALSAAVAEACAAIDAIVRQP